MKKQATFITLGVAMFAALAIHHSAQTADTTDTYKIFIYAGQSNAQGKAHIVVADGLAENPETKDFFKHLRKDGEWVVRDDVFYRYAGQGPEGSYGPLKIGKGSFRFGGDYEFSSMMGDHFKESVVISKSAYGGSSLYQKFRPPSAGLPSDEKLQTELEKAKKRVEAANAKSKKNDPLPTMDDIKKNYGLLYRQIVLDYQTLTGDIDKWFPELEGRKAELAGFVWFQGWNDQYGGQDEYETNMKLFINDMRNDLGAPKLPFVIVAMGQNGSKPASGPMLTIREAQMSMMDLPEFKGNVSSFRSDLLVDMDAERLMNEKPRDKEASKVYASDGAYHYYGSPIWYTRIGHSAGKAMLELLKNQSE